MSYQMPKCESCLYFRAERPEVGKPISGECMLNPPEMLPNFHGDSVPLRPAVKIKDWCASHAADPMWGAA